MNVRGAMAALVVLVIAVAGTAAGASGSVSGGRAIRWKARYDGPAHAGDVAATAGFSPDATKLFVTGGSNGATTGNNFLTVAYDAASGARLWTRDYDGPAHGFDFAALFLAVSPDGTKVYVTGGSTGTATGLDYATIAYDTATGRRLWVARYDGAGGVDYAAAVVASVDGTRVYITGSSTGAGTDFDYATIAYDAANGAQLWVARYDGPVNGADFPNSLAVSPDGSKLWVTGGSTGTATDSDYATISYDASTGATRWARRSDGPASGRDVAWSLALGPDASKLYVTGESAGSTTDADYLTVAYDATTGAGIWTRRYNGTANSPDSAAQIAVSPDGQMVVATGRAGATTGSAFATVAYGAADGARLWVRRYQGPAGGFDTGFRLGFAGASEVVVTGLSNGVTSGWDYATIAYDASAGARLWARRYDSPDSLDDAPLGLAVSPDGAYVAVMGQSRGATTDNDWETIVYSTQ